MYILFICELHLVVCVLLGNYCKNTYALVVLNTYFILKMYDIGSLS